MDINILLSPPVAFLLFILVGLGLYALGRAMAGPSVPEEGKAETYACGEEFEGARFQFGYAKFYIAALFFTVMHVAALTIATVPSGADAWKGFLYLGAIALAISILYVDFD